MPGPVSRWFDLADHLFCVSIPMLADDVRDSALRPTDGYLARLELEPDLQQRFTRAISNLMAPQQVAPNPSP